MQEVDVTTRTEGATGTWWGDAGRCTGQPPTRRMLLAPGVNSAKAENPALGKMCSKFS